MAAAFAQHGQEGETKDGARSETNEQPAPRIAGTRDEAAIQDD